MYKLFKALSAAALLIATPAAVQAQDDAIYFHNGQTIVGKVLSVDEKEVNFVYLKMEQVKCGRHAIEKIVYAAGHTDIMSPKIIVTSKNDWEKVQILLPTDDVSGLKYQGFVGDIRKPVTPEMLPTDKEAVRKIKEEAATKGFPFVQVSARKNIAYSYN
ncbi:MAG: hypothetical protein JNL72_12865 [Flavipsychrobacter sp.]|nr:hypothetical protein [Flavipsychrobacter sp.]